MHHALVSSQFACTVRFTYPAAAGTGDLDQDPLRGLPAPAIPVGAGVGVLAFLAKRIADLLDTYISAFRRGLLAPR